MHVWLNWCARNPIGRSLTGLQHNPISDMGKPTSEQASDHFFSERELVWFFRALPSINRERVFKEGEEGRTIRFDRYFEFLMRSLVRRSNALGFLWSMIDGENVLFPSSDTKARIYHLMYLAPQMRGLIGVRPNDAGDDVRVFDDVNKDSLKRAVGRLRDEMMRLAAKEKATVADWTPHSFRHTGKTWMSSQGIPTHVSERVIQHKATESKIVRVYNHYEYQDEKREALIRWNAYLDGVKAKAEAVSE